MNTHALHRKLICTLLFLFSFSLTSESQTITDSLLYKETPPYSEIISRFHLLDSLSRFANMYPYGETDGGQNIHLFVMSKNGIFDPVRLHELGITVLLVNNGIHPGEPDGINASLLLAERLLANDAKLLPEHVAICIIPVMNIEGSLERGCCSRVNQNGPPEYGFRANGQYLDLNRDFIKADSQNLLSWIKIFQQWDPEVLIDTHVSDGADYQYNMTLISSQKDKLYPLMGTYIQNTLTPAIFKKMKNKGEEICPYVETLKWDLPPDSGISAFLETPRFSTGYAALFNCFGFISESHMLKDFTKRVRATELLLQSVLELCDEKSSEINEKKKEARKEMQFQISYPINWQLDTNRSQQLSFRGFEHVYRTSNVTGLPQLYYDHQKPVKLNIPYYQDYIATDTIQAPLYYLIPQAWKRIIRILNTNGIRLLMVRQDSTTSAIVSYIEDYKTMNEAYEGHYLHYDTKVLNKTETVQVNKGDYLVPVFQKTGNRYLIETLEPVADDSYFNWGFFDAILQQKEWYSAYAFDPIAEEVLASDSVLNQRFIQKKKEDPNFASSSFEQLYYIYKNSKYFEKNLKRYPVCRIGSMKEAVPEY